MPWLPLLLLLPAAVPVVELVLRPPLGWLLLEELLAGMVSCSSSSAVNMT